MVHADQLILANQVENDDKPKSGKNSTANVKPYTHLLHDVPGKGDCLPCALVIGKMYADKHKGRKPTGQNLDQLGADYRRNILDKALTAYSTRRDKTDERGKVVADLLDVYPDASTSAHFSTLISLMRPQDYYLGDYFIYRSELEDNLLVYVYEATGPGGSYLRLTRDPEVKA